VELTAKAEHTRWVVRDVGKKGSAATVVVDEGGDGAAGEEKVVGRCVGAHVDLGIVLRKDAELGRAEGGVEGGDGGWEENGSKAVNLDWRRRISPEREG